MRHRWIFFLALSFPLLITFDCGYYSFGWGDQLEWIGVIQGLLNPQLFHRDFIIESQSGYSPRFFFIRWLTFLSRGVGIPYAFLLMHLVKQMLLAAVTFGFARRLGKHNDVAGLCASALVLSVSVFDLGGLGHLQLEWLTPHTLGVSIGLCALWMFWLERFAMGFLVAMLAILIHPLVGTFTSALALLTLLVAGRSTPSATSVRRATFCLAGVATFAWLLWVDLAEPLTPEEFYLFAYIRYPHHYLVASYPASDWGLFIVSYVAIGAVLWQFASGFDTRFAALIGALWLILGCSFAIAYAFTVLLPLSAMLAVLPFRMTFLCKWLLLVAIGAAVGVNVHGAANRKELYVGVALVSLLMTISDPSEWLRTLMFALIIVAVVCWRDRLFIPTLATWIVALIMAVSGLSRGWLNQYAPIVVPSNYTTLTPFAPWNDVADFARHSIPVDALVWGPPRDVDFRIRAERALFFDTKVMCYSNACLRTWQERLVGTYGEVKSTGYDLVSEVQGKFHDLPVQDAVNVVDKYSITHLLLPNSCLAWVQPLYRGRKFSIFDAEKVLAASQEGVGRQVIDSGQTLCPTEHGGGGQESAF